MVFSECWKTGSLPVLEEVADGGWERDSGIVGEEGSLCDILEGPGEGGEG